ncbi:carbohydrate porin [Sphingomonas sp. So64.6b]|uniref:carbohydrate porin n=1 Tax=Sphingomonas sp. So64.6b TaxID=2997354 RepID=UPI0016043EEC|nr:carbohydrate porin [Sphingomonas sp. So64.6b]QNA86287.1 carbohydrate porin [Sphingomonas sp. So64.6b]
MSAMSRKWRTVLTGAVPLMAVALATPACAQDVEEPGIVLGASYITDILTVADGGVRRGTAWLGRADLTVAIDGRAIGLDGIAVFADLLATQPTDFSGRIVGDGQTVSNVQADSAIRPFEAWIEAQASEATAVKAGLIDLNTEFDIQSTGALFLHSSHGIGPDFSQSGANGPSIFPSSSTAIVVRHTRGKVRLRAGLFDGIAGSVADPRRSAIRFPGSRGALLVAEIEHRIGRSGEVQLGAWRYTDRFDALDPTRPRVVSQGAYALIEGPLGRGIDGWVRVGVADDRTNPIGLYLGGGIAHGPPHSRIGVAVAHARLGMPARRSLIDGHVADRAETALELTWARRVVEGVVVQPAVQYVINPGWNPATLNALVIGARLRFALAID